MTTQFTSSPLNCVSVILVTSLISACSHKNDGTAAAPVPETPTANILQSTQQKATDPIPQTLPTSINVQGKLLNVGYVENATVCFDLNDSTACDANEPYATTNATGDYSLTIPSGRRGTSLIAVITSDSKDSANSSDRPIVFTHGWTLPTLLDYDRDTKTIQQNITTVSMVNYARQRVRGRSQESNKINTFHRVVGEANLHPQTKSMILPTDFDYVLSPKNNLSDRLYGFHELLNERSIHKASALSMLDVTAYGYALYGTYGNASDTEATQSANVAELITEIEEGNDIAEEFKAVDHRYFRPNTDAVTQLRIGLTETTGWSRSENSGELNTIGRRSLYLKNGKAALTFEDFSNGVWQPVTVTEDPTFTLSLSGELVTINETDSQQPRTISHVDGNQISMRMPGNSARVAYDLSNSPGTHFFIEEWVDEQQSINWYYPEGTPDIDPFSEEPSCAKNYPDYRHQPNPRGSGLGTWYTQCFDYFTAEYYSEVLGDLKLTYEDPVMPGATFYDITLLDPITIFPASKNCGDQTTISKVVTNGIEHCNWAIDNNGGHSIQELFNDSGVLIHSWSYVYGESSFEIDDNTLIAGTHEQLGQPQQLTVHLNREGNATSGTGSIYSAYGGWTTASYSPLTEEIVWEQSPNNSNLILIEFPFRDVNNPTVPSNTQSDGITPALGPAVLSGARQADRSRSTHFSTTWNNSTFRMDQSTHTSINREKIAIYLTADGHFLVGQHFGAGYTFSERYFNTQAFDEGVKAMQYILNKLFNIGWIDKVLAPQISETETET